MQFDCQRGEPAAQRKRRCAVRLPAKEKGRGAAAFL